MAGGETFLQRPEYASGDSEEEESFGCPHAKRRKFKSQSEQQHKVDHSPDTQLNHEIFGWEASYADRALLVRIMTNKKGEKFTNLSKVKFFSKEKTSQPKICQTGNDLCIKTSRSYRCDMGLTVDLSNFYDRISNILMTFDRSDPIENQYWRQIVNCIELFYFKYEKHQESVVSWVRKSKAEDEELSSAYNNLGTEQKKFISKLSTALFADLRNGEGKRWVTQLVEELMKVANISSGDMEVLVPVISDKTNTSVEVISVGESFSEAVSLFDRPIEKTDCFTGTSELISSPSLLLTSSPESSTSLSDEETTWSTKSTRVVVPDICVVLSDFPGTFPLVIELQPAHEEVKGRKQNLQQIISKLFFQDIVFGITITPISFCVQAVIKREDVGQLEFVSSSVISLAKYSGDERCLCLESFSQMCKFIFNVLKWGKEHKCMLKETTQQAFNLESMLSQC